MYPCAYRNVYPCHHPTGRARGNLCQATDSRTYHVCTYRLPTCTPVSYAISGVLRTVQRLCWSAGKLLLYFNYILVRCRLLCSRRLTKVKKAGVLGFFSCIRILSSSLAPVLALPVRLPARPTISSNPTPFSTALCYRGPYCPYVRLFHSSWLLRSNFSVFFCAYLPCSRPRTPLPVIIGWPPVSYTTCVPNTPDLPKANTMASGHDIPMLGTQDI